ncbi:MAG: hypothetical protein ACD_73C00352G0002 [uncultured bacterium]|nr:MAG: hypothetical protein ACD_73C00352G0002 [uncultured bacterium]
MKKTIIIAVLFLLFSSTFSLPVYAAPDAVWNCNAGGICQIGGNGHYTKLTIAESNSNGILVTSTLVPTPQNGQCGPNGGIYFDASQPSSKYLYSTVLAAVSMNRDVIVSIDCDPIKQHARLIEVDLLSTDN